MRHYLRSEIVKLPRVHRVRKGRKVYKYHKVTREKLPEDIPEDHPDFTAAWAVEEAKKPHERQRCRTGSIADAVTQYLRSQQFSSLSKEYAATIRRNVQDIFHTYGEAPVEQLTKDHIDLDIGKFRGNQKVSRRKAWRQLGTFWKESGLTLLDPSSGTMSAKAPKGAGHLPWTPEQIEIYRTAHPIGSVQRECLELVYWTAARTVDAVSLGPRMIGHDGILTYTQSKTKEPAYVPWSSPLPDWGRGMIRDRQFLMDCLRRNVFTFLETSQNKPRTKKGLSNIISSAARKAGIEGRSAHGLRKSRLIALAENGASVHVIMSWGGHKTLSEAQHYITEANRKSILIGTEQDRNTVNHSDPSDKTSTKWS